MNFKYDNSFYHNVTHALKFENDNTEYNRVCEVTVIDWLIDRHCLWRRASDLMRDEWIYKGGIYRQRREKDGSTRWSAIAMGALVQTAGLHNISFPQNTESRLCLFVIALCTCCCRNNIWAIVKSKMFAEEDCKAKREIWII